MGNASDTSDVFVSKISKEHDILIGSIYSVFCKSAAFHAPCGCFLSQQCVFLSPCRYSVPHGQLHPAASRISQAVHAEAGRVLHRQSVHQRPGDDAHLVSSGDTVFFFTQVWTDGWRFGPNRLHSFQIVASHQFLVCPDVHQNWEKQRKHVNKKEEIRECRVRSH